MKLATIQKISEVIPHPNADRLTIYKMEGLSWRVISAEKFGVGEYVIYISVDTVVPDRPEFEFLRDRKFRVNCIKLRGEYSNGLIVPLSILGDKFFKVGEDVSEIIGVVKYEKPVSYTSGEVAGKFPTHLIAKTDEERIENFPEIIKKVFDKEVYASIKADGSSVTVINHPEEGFKVCSRNLEIKESKDSKYWQPVFKYGLQENLPDGFAIQFELIGEGIQKNPEKIKGVDARVFNVWELENRSLFNFDEMVEFCENMRIPMVDIYFEGKFKYTNVDELINESRKVKYKNGAKAEGLVWRLKNHEYCEELQKELSFKVINYDYKD